MVKSLAALWSPSEKLLDEIRNYANSRQTGKQGVLLRDALPSVFELLANPSENQTLTVQSDRSVLWQFPCGHLPFYRPVNDLVRLDNPGSLKCIHCDAEVRRKKSLASLYPELLLEWDWKKNAQLGLDPNILAAKSNRQAHWIHSHGCGHSWPAIVANRASGSGCPHCTSNKSVREAHVAAELRALGFKVSTDTSLKKNRGERNARSVDVVVSGFNIKIGIEIDGPSHRNKEDKDRKKNEDAKRELDLEIIRTREKPLEKIDQRDVLHEKDGDIYMMMCDLVRVLVPYAVGDDNVAKLQRYLSLGALLDPAGAERILMASMGEFRSLLEVNPRAAADFDRQLSVNHISAAQVRSDSSVEFSFSCDRDHPPYRRTPNYLTSREISEPCPYCSRKALTDEAHLKHTHPTLWSEILDAGEMNKADTLDSLHDRSSKKVYRRCPNPLCSRHERPHLIEIRDWTGLHKGRKKRSCRCVN